MREDSWLTDPKEDSLWTADVFPVVDSLPLKNKKIRGEERRPKIRLRFAGYKEDPHPENLEK